MVEDVWCRCCYGGGDSNGNVMMKGGPLFCLVVGSDDCVRGMENGVANVASEYGRRDGYVYSFGYSDCSSIPI